MTKPIEALKDFYSMGLDMLVLEDFVIRKESTADSKPLTNGEIVPAK